MRKLYLFTMAFALVGAGGWAQPEGARAAEHELTSQCDELPKGNLSNEELKRLVPDDSPGKVRIRWRTESQDDNYGFNVYRSDTADTSYTKINKSIIPGEGSTNIPKDYCYMDQPLKRGAVFYYYIESVSNSGVAEVVEGTKNVKVKVKTVEEEREWLRKKAAGIDTATTNSLTTKTVEQPRRPLPMRVQMPAKQPTEAPQGKNPLD